MGKKIMNPADSKYKNYLQILREELVPAMGCTEPIAIAYGAAKARDTLGGIPDRVRVEASGNIIKNVKSVIVPNTNHLKGIEAAVAAGIVAGKSEKILEVIADVSEEQKLDIARYIKDHNIEVTNANTGLIFDIIITLYKGTEYVKLRISHYHTNISLVEKNGKILFQVGDVAAKEEGLADRSQLNIEDIIDFADTVLLEDVDKLIGRQIDYNYAIAQEGLRGNYGANIGRVMLNTYGNDIKNRAKAMAAAGSDARMGGCELPVIIVSGSGNQGMAASLPVIEYAKELNVGREKMIRAVLLSDLVTIHQKTGIGRLSAYCGAVSAGCASATGIAYLMGGRYDEIAHTLVNSLAIVSGIVCDGAKASCAAKIVSAVDAGILGYYMYENGQQFYVGDGIVTKGVENTLRNIGRLGKEGMKETDKEIIKIMIGE